MKKDAKKLHREYSWLYGAGFIILRITLYDLDRAYANILKKSANHPKFKYKNNHDTYRTVCIRGVRNNRKYSNIKVDLKNKTIKLPKLNEIKIRENIKLKIFVLKVID